eukprot:62747_1
MSNISNTSQITEPKIHLDLVSVESEKKRKKELFVHRFKAWKEFFIMYFYAFYEIMSLIKYYFDSYAQNGIKASILLSYLVIIYEFHVNKQEVISSYISLVMYFDNLSGSKSIGYTFCHLILAFAPVIILYVFYGVIDTFGFFNQYKIKVINVEIRKKYIERYTTTTAMTTWLKELVQVFIVFIFVTAMYMRFTSNVISENVENINTLEIICKLIVGKYLYDIIEYTYHRFQHYPGSIMYAMHKTHHQVLSPTVFDLGNDFTEDLLEIIKQKLVLHLLSMDPFCSLMFTALIFCYSCEIHSGWALKFTLNPFSYFPGCINDVKFHHMHHSHNNGNYAVYWIDYLFGTISSSYKN